MKIAEDERTHLQNFVNLYYTLTKRHPQYEVERIAINTFEEGLNEAFDDELKDYETYRNQYLKSKNQAIRDIFLRAFSDEIKHATRINSIKSSLAKNSTEDAPSLQKKYETTDLIHLLWILLRLQSVMIHSELRYGRENIYNLL